jgi:peroxiredoxin
MFIPRLDALQARYGAEGLTTVGLSTEDAEDLALFVRRAGVRYGVGSDARGETTRAYGVTSMPTLVVVDRAGAVREVTVGYDQSELPRLEALVRALLAEAAAPSAPPPGPAPTPAPAVAPTPTPTPTQPMRGGVQ